MQPYMSPRKLTEDPLDGPHPTRQTKWAGKKRRPAAKRRARIHKKGARQHEHHTTEEL
jgi:hypothetical protein